MSAAGYFHRRIHPGTGMAALIAAIFIVALCALLTVQPAPSVDFLFSGYVRRLLISASVQAFLSTLISLIAGALLALALARLHAGVLRRSALAVLGVMTALPGIVIIFAVISVYGRSGWGAGIFDGLGHRIDFSIYGLHGIVLAHAALNGPVAARVFFYALQGNPQEQMRLAAVLRFTPVQVFRFCDWPVLQRVLPGLAALIFLMCFTSFAIVLALGGGPRNATLEVAIYELIRVEADFSRAAMLAILQIMICGMIVTIAGFSLMLPAASGDGRAVMRADAHALALKAGDAIILFIAGVFLLSLIAASLAGIFHIPAILDTDLWLALATSLMIAIPAAIVSMVLAVAIAFAARDAHYRMRWRGFALLHGAIPLAVIAVPPFALAAGLYLVLRPLLGPALMGWVLVPFINGMMALPFVYRLLESPLMTNEEKFGRIAAHLDMQGLNRFRIMDWPVVRRPLFAALALALALSLGDFGVATLFGTELRTLPLLLHERLGAYRLDEASAIAGLLVLLVVGLSMVTEFFSHARD